MAFRYKLHEREKKFLLIGAIVVLIVISFSIFSWYDSFSKNIKEVSDTKLFMLQKQIEKLASRQELQQEAKALKKELISKEKTFLKGDKHPVAAAALQRILKETALQLGIDIKLERTLNPVVTDYYLGIPVEIGFTASTEKLRDLLYELRTSQYLLTISEIKIRVTNIRNPLDVYATLVVRGFINKSGAVDTKDKEIKNAA